MSATPKPAGVGQPDPRKQPDHRIYSAGTASASPTEESYHAREAKQPGGPSSPSANERDKLIHNEQTKLTATLLNGVALGFIVGGGVTTLVGLTNYPVGVDPIPLTLVWLLTGFILHMIGRLFLRSLL